MAVVTKEQLLEKFKARFGTEDTSDETLGLLEDLSDTLDANKPSGEDWKTKYEENDAAWRKKYRDRFYSGKDDPDPEEDKHDKQSDETLTYDKLFEEEKK